MNFFTLLVLCATLIPTIPLQAPALPEVTVAFSYSGSLYTTNFKDEPTQLTHDGSYNILPTWSADGQYLAYLSATSYESPAHLRVMNMTNGEVKQISSLELTSETNLAWSPDGQHIAVTLGALYVIDLDTEQTRQLSVDYLSAQSPSWSPDSAQIAFQANEHIYVIYEDGHNTHKISQLYAYNYQPLWAQATNQILFFSNKENGIGMNVADGETNKTTEILEFKRIGLFNPEWSTDGKQIAVTLSSENSSELTLIDFDDVYVLNADGTHLHAVSSRGIDNLIGWTSDNQHVLYQSSEPGGAAVSIFISNVENGNATKISHSALEQMCSYGNCQNMTIRPELGTN